jgi:hypothetical protein
MPMGAIQLVPGVNTEKTLSANQTGVSHSQLIRYKDQMIQTLGGWEQKFVRSASTVVGSSLIPVVISSTVKDLLAWQDIQARQWLSAAATNNVVVVGSDNSYLDITPQTTTTNPLVRFSISSGSRMVRIDDPQSGPTLFNTVFLNTPVAIGNLLLSGGYDITTVLSTGGYNITSSVVASTTIASSGKLPIFNTSSGTPVITVTLPNHNYQAILGLQQTFRAPTVVDGQTVFGPYNIATVIDSTQFTIVSNIISSGTATATMNSTLAQIVYYIALGPQALGSGFGAGGFGLGGFGTGSNIIGAVGTPILAEDWSQCNWGEILLACPRDGPIYQWSPNLGLYNMQVISEAPFFNGGIFISQPQQILVAWRSTQSSGTQDNLIVRWSTSGNFVDWEPRTDNTAGRFHIPSGSIIVGGLQAPTRGVIWTDIDAWIMQYVGGDVIFNFTKVGSGCGLAGQHACAIIAGEVYWMGKSNFFKLGDSGVQPIPCSVWDFVFQNINTDHYDKIRCAPNSAFNEITWFFPNVNSTENNSYVKLNLVEGEWDYGLLSRTAWTDVSVLGNPIGADPLGAIWQHEEGEAQSGTPITSFRSGWWSLSEGQDLVFVDFMIPDFKWSLLAGTENANINITFYSADYPGEEPRVYGPYTVTKLTDYISPRIRGRLMSVLIQSNNDVFWRIGQIRYRFASSGRR